MIPTLALINSVPLRVSYLLLLFVVFLFLACYYFIETLDEPVRDLLQPYLPDHTHSSSMEPSSDALPVTAFLSALLSPEGLAGHIGTFCGDRVDTDEFLKDSNLLGVCGVCILYVCVLR